MPELGFGAVVERFWLVEKGVWGEMEMEDEGVSLGWVLDAIGGNAEMGIGEVGDMCGR
jgi:hypothetical protein